MKEYYPEDYAKLKKYISQGKWFTGGSSVEEGDVNSPSEESLIRQVLYGNQFFRREFGTESAEHTLPDCFGFPASLPSILAHAGLKGFSTQKLTWGSAVGIPFNVGNWIGPDGQSVVAALNATSYGSSIDGDLTKDPYWVERIAGDVTKTGVGVDFRYYGVGDRGGSVEEKDLKNLILSQKSDGPFKIYAGRMDKMFTDLTPEQKAKLPSYQGDLELTQHSAGSLSSEAAMKKWNRANELLADSSERASVAADWLGALPYDRDRITDGWLRFLPGQFHDLMAGTALPLAYTYTWNDEILAMNEFAGVLQQSVGGVARSLDTRVKGIPVVLYNPISIQRTDVAEANVTFADDAPSVVTVVGPDGKTVPSQVVSKSGKKAKILFLASAPSVGFTTYDVRPGISDASSGSELSVTDRKVENARYAVTLDEAGDVASIFDKKANKELLSAPARLVYQHENPREYPAWNMDWDDQKKPPSDIVTGPAEFKIVENGPVRVGLRVIRHHAGSTFIQTIRLGAGLAGNRVEFSTQIDWQGKESALKADFPLTVSNPEATYNWGLGTIKRPGNNSKKYEAASHQWFDLTAKDDSYGVSVLDDAKYGSDKPEDNDLRLTLLYSPGTRAGYQHQGTQDWGHHEFLYALEGHVGTWQAGQTQWESARLSQPLIAFQAPIHDGTEGKSFSVAQVSDPNISIETLKKAEDSGDIIVRFNELAGSDAKQVRATFAGPILSAREVDGQERTIGSATVVGGSLVFDTTAYRPKAFALRLGSPTTRLQGVKSTPLWLPYNVDVVSTWKSKKDGNFDGEGRSLPGELLPSTISSDGITFKMGPTTDGAKNAVVANGQVLSLPAGKSRTLYVLAASTQGDTPAVFDFGAKKAQVTIQSWSGYIGQWDSRQWEGTVPELTYDWNNAYAGLVPGYIKRAPVAWYADHRRLADGTNSLYDFCYLFRYAIKVPDGTNMVNLPTNDKVRILAATVAENPNEEAKPAGALYETLGKAQADEPVISPAPGKFSDVTEVSVGHPMYWTSSDKLRYTLDGSTPTNESPIYSGPIRLYSPTVLTAAQFDESGKRGPLAVSKFDVKDSTAPSVTAVVATTFAPSIQIRFSEKLDPSSAVDPTHYSLSSGTTVQSASLSKDGCTVTLKLSGILSDNSTTLKIDHVKDISPAGNEAPISTAISLLSPTFSTSEEQAFDGSKAGMVNRGVPGLPTKGDKPWTLNLFVYMDATPGELTPIAGFGDGEDRSGAERFILKFRDAISFWGSNVDVKSTEAFDLHRWQMITMTYDGANVRIYKDGREIGSGAAAFSDAENEVRLAPRPAWGEGHLFSGKIAGLTIWSEALPASFVPGLLATGPVTK
jgi:alpha-mannosidase